MKPRQWLESGTNPVGRRMMLWRTVLALPFVMAALGLGVSEAASTWTVTGVTQVTGTQDMFRPGAGVANLDAGDLVAGVTRWDNDGDGIVFNDTHVGFLWSAADGARVFEISDALYFNSNFHFPSSIAADQTVVGTDLFLEDFKSLPFLWTPSDGFNLMPLPCPGPPPGNRGGVSVSDCIGSATDVSSDGSVAVGISRQGIIGNFPTMALQWSVTRSGRRLRLDERMLPTSDAWSDAWAVSADGTVIVGDSGPTDTSLHAVRWVNGTLQPLEAVAGPSSARFTSSDGEVAVGLADFGTRKVIVIWDAAGSATVAEPPAGTSVESINAINASGDAAVGAISAGGNFAPYLWTRSGGFTVIPEAGREQDYDSSEALDVSDDGTVVVGALQARVVSNGDPAPRGFLWTASDGLILIDDLLADFGFPNAGTFKASAISGDATRVLVTGTFPAPVTDTTSLVVALAGP